MQQELTKLEDELQVRLPIVHGGIGPVTPNDLRHAEIERKYGYSPVYTFLSGVHPIALRHAAIKKLEIRKHRTIQSLLNDVKERCCKVQWKVEKRVVEHENEFAKRSRFKASL